MEGRDAEMAGDNDRPLPEVAQSTIRDLTDLFRAVERIDTRTARLETAMYFGDGDAKPVLSRLERLEERTSRVENAAPRAGVWAGAGTALGAALGALLVTLGIRPPGQGQ